MPVYLLGAGFKWTVLNMLLTVIKGIVHHKIVFLSLFTYMFSQTCIHFYLQLNTKEDILYNLGNQTVAGPH